MQHPVTPPTYPSDEIDLRELALTLWASKWLILLITLVVTACAAAYALWTPPTYQVQVNIAPPRAQSLENYNMAYQLAGPAMSALTGTAASDIAPLTPATAVQAVYATATSAEFRHDFLQAMKDFGKNDGADAQANTGAALPTVTSGTAATGSPQVTMLWQGHDPDAMTMWADRYATLALAAAKDDVVRSLGSAIAQNQAILKQQITTLREAAKIKLDNEITHLEEALALANAIGLEEPSSIDNLVISYTGDMAYMRGAKALKADVALRRARTNLDPYISELPNILKQRALLDTIHVDPEQLNVGVREQDTPLTAYRIKPKTRLIIALGLVLGGMLGVFWVLIRQVFRRPEPVA